MVTFDQQVKGVLVRGILPEAEPRVSFLPEKLTAGELVSLLPENSGLSSART